MPYLIQTKRGKFPSINPYVQRVNDLHTRIDRGEKELIKLENEKSSLSIDYANYLDIKENLSKEVQLLNSQITKVKIANKELSDERDRLLLQTSKSQQTIIEKEQELLREQQVITEAKKEYSSLFSDIEHLRSALNDYQKFVELLPKLQKEYQELSVAHEELQKSKTATDQQISIGLKAFEEQKEKLLEIESQQKKTYAEMNEFANRIEHNTLRLNKLYQRGAIKIKFDVPLEEWKTF